MTTEAPDPRTFKTWEDAFQYPIPVVRKLESQLRSNAGDNREKLRSLVGASYRDLLDTAETIVDMEQDMQQVETILGYVGQKCNSRAVDRISSNVIKMDNYLRAREKQRYAFASQLTVLRSCPIVISRLVKRHRSYLLAAKVLVISRLIHKDLSQSQSRPPIVDQIRDKIGNLRRRLLAQIDQQFAGLDAEPSALVDSMCAYSLATSSTPTDVLRHFHRVRTEAIKDCFDNQQDLAKSSMHGLKLCLRTFQDTQAIFPRRLADTLVKLKAHPLLQDAEVRMLVELNLDIHERWITEEARVFTPWPRHDELQRPEAERLLGVWAKEAMSAFIRGMKSVLSDTKDLHMVSSLRHDLIESWTSSSIRTPGLKSSVVLDDLRELMNSQLKILVRMRAQKIISVGIELNNTIGTWPLKGSDTGLSLWSIASTPMDVSNGAQSFKQTIVDQSHGRVAKVTRLIAIYDQWSESVMEIRNIIKSMKETRWDDEFGDESDGSDNDFGLHSKQRLLSEEDPKLLEDVTFEALKEALSNLQKTIEDIVHRLTADDQETRIPQALFVIRVARNIGERLPRLWLRDSKSTSIFLPFPSSLFAPLYHIIARQVVRPHLKPYERSLLHQAKSQHTQGRMLWEGNPPLPVQPSPDTFRFLRSLTKDMATYGSDLWVPDAARTMRTVASSELARLWHEVFTLIESEDSKSSSLSQEQIDEQEGHMERSTGEKNQAEQEIRHDKVRQLLFDILYTQRYVGPLGLEDKENPWTSLLKSADDLLGDDAARHRLEKGAADYGKRTYLLFALLM